MLCNITIENVAVIEKATAEFESGFNVLTGETGAGKSILIDSINAILGNRTSKEIVRHGANKAKIWASFDYVPAYIKHALEDAGYTPEDELLIQREISSEGKSTCRINNMPATTGFLKEICSGLINIHGQNDNQNLLNPAKHINILDAFAQNNELISEYRTIYSELVSVRKEFAKLDLDAQEKQHKIDLLTYEVEEIEQADLKIDEYENLLQRREIIKNSQAIVEALNSSYIALNGDDDIYGAVTLLGDAANQLTSVSDYSETLADYSETLNDAYYNIRELASELQNDLSKYDFNPIEIEEIETRLDLIYRLEQKYGKGIENIFAYYESACKQLEDIEYSTQRIEELEKKEKKLYDEAFKLATELSNNRTEAFDKFNEKIISALNFLNMPGISLELKKKETELSSTGKDNVEFYISTNLGETSKPMAKIASGGELSRIMLAFKSALADRDDIPTVIYDEIDTGISGSTSGRIGQMLKKTANGRQVICVTHTAQVAAYAQNHFLIEKQIKEGRTYTNIKTLKNEERALELARIISGENISETAIAGAKEMLEKAANS